MKFHTLASVFLISLAQAEKIPVFVGTGSSEGIQKITFDTESGALTEAVKVADLQSPSALCISSDKKFLFSTGRGPDEKGKMRIGSVHSFEILADFSLKSINSQPSVGLGPCHIFTHPEGHSLFVANYSGGSVTSYKLREGAKISTPVSNLQNEGSSVNERRQNGPHAHSIYTSPDGKFVYSADLGTDEVLVYSLDSSSSALKRISTAKVPAGGGPRHMTFNKDGSLLYVLNELTLTISIFQRDATSGQLSIKSTHPISKKPVDKTLTCSEIRLSDNGEFLYIAKRDLAGNKRDAICVLRTEDMNIIQEHPADIWIPRHFNISPDGKWLLVAGQKSDKVIVHARDPKTGLLSSTKHHTSVTRPMWILFP